MKGFVMMSGDFVLVLFVLAIIFFCVAKAVSLLVYLSQRLSDR
jgi:hypothetical protein